MNPKVFDFSEWNKSINCIKVLRYFIQKMAGKE